MVYSYALYMARLHEILMVYGENGVNLATTTLSHLLYIPHPYVYKDYATNMFLIFKWI